MISYLSSALKHASVTDFILQFWWGMSSKDLDKLYLQVYKEDTVNKLLNQLEEIIYELTSNETFDKSKLTLKQKFHIGRIHKKYECSRSS